MKPVVVTGTDTGVGKTVVSAMLTLCLDGVYWKPVQAGNANGTDTTTVASLTQLPQSHFRDERYVLKEPLSPHRAAELDNIEIEEDKLSLPDDIPEAQWLIVEGAGGILVPFSRKLLQADIFARWGVPVLLCALTGLGTINHSLLSIETLHQRNIRISGIVFLGEAMPDTEQTICELGNLKHLGRLPLLKRLGPDTLREAFSSHFDRAAFEAAYAG